MLKFIYAMDAVAPRPYENIVNTLENTIEEKPNIGILILVGALLLSAAIVTWAVLTKEKSKSTPTEETTGEEKTEE